MPCPAIADDTALVREKYVKKHPVDVSIATDVSGEQNANLFKKEPLMWFLFYVYRSDGYVLTICLVYHHSSLYFALGA